jgi:hypothetical protein
MDMSDRNRRAAEEPGRGQIKLLPDGSMWLVILLLPLVAAGGCITLLLGSLGPALGACILALWAVPTLAVVGKLVKRIIRRCSKRHEATREPPPAEGRNPESIPEAGRSTATSKGDRKRRSRRWVLTIETSTDEDEG